MERKRIKQRTEEAGITLSPAEELKKTKEDAAAQLDDYFASLEGSSSFREERRG